MTHTLVLLYDGVCALCNGVVKVTLRYDRTGTIRFAPLDGDFARGVLDRHPQLRGIDSVVFVEQRDGVELVSARSDAVIALARHSAWPWRATRLLRLVPRPLRDAGYDLVARTRYRVFGRYDTCPLPPPAERHRFIL